MAKKPALAALLLGLAGCINVPPRVDPFAGLTVVNSSYRGLAVGLLLSENTKNSLKLTADLSAKDADPVGKNVFQDYRGSMGEHGEKIFPAVVDLLKKDFKTVIKIDSMEEAGRVNVDLVAVLDIYTGLPLVKLFPIPGVTDAKAEISAIFLTLDGKTLDTVSGKAAKTPGMPRSSRNINAAVDTARDEALASFENALLASESLAAFAKARPGAPAAAARAPIPAAPRSDVDKPGYKLSERERDFALVIGVEKYAGLPDAQFAERDAETMRDHLLALGYPARNIVLLTGARATSGGMRKNLETWLPNNVRADSTVFFYYSGHGAPDPQSGQAYLVPADGDPQYLEDTAYPTKRLYAKLGALKARRVIVAMDACFSGAGGRSVLAKGVRPLVGKVEMGESSSDKITAFSASGAEQISGTADDQGHGLFTYYFLKGLNERGGKASPAALHDYLRPKVEDRAKRDNRDQTPQLTPSKARAEAL